MPAETFSSDGQVAILATALVTLITTIATLFYQFVREGRRHKWEVEAAKRHVAASKRSEDERKDIADRVEKAEITLNAKIDENTAISQRAFTEANHMNEKLADQNIAFDRLLSLALAASPPERSSSEALDHVQATVDDTAEKVTDIHQRVIDDEDGA